MASDDLRASVDAMVRRGLAFEAADPDSVPVEITNSVVEIIRDIAVPLRDELARLQGELRQERETSQRLMDQRQQMAEERYTWQERGDRAELERDIALARLAGARTLHQPEVVETISADRDERSGDACSVCQELWPCPTVQTLDAPPRGLSAPYCGAYMTEWVCTLPPGRHRSWRHVDADGNWWDQTRCPTDCGEPVYRHAANGCPEGPKSAHSCGNCDGIDPDTCPFNPTHTKENPS